jgi:hypothetical protein
MKRITSVYLIYETCPSTGDSALLPVTKDNIQLAGRLAAMDLLAARELTFQVKSNGKTIAEVTVDMSEVGA